MASILVLAGCGGSDGDGEGFLFTGFLILVLIVLAVVVALFVTAVLVMTALVLVASAWKRLRAQRR